MSVTWLPAGSQVRSGSKPIISRPQRRQLQINTRTTSSPPISPPTQKESSPATTAMSRDMEEDIIDVDGSDDDGEEEYEVESITGFKWEVSIGAVELPCRQLGKASRSHRLCQSASCRGWSCSRWMRWDASSAMPRCNVEARQSCRRVQPHFRGQGRRIAGGMGSSSFLVCAKEQS